MVGGAGGVRGHIRGGARHGGDMAGQFEEALISFEKVPCSNHLPLCLALLGACSCKSVNMRLARWAFEQSLRMDENCAAAYICMGNVYAF